MKALCSVGSAILILFIDCSCSCSNLLNNSDVAIFRISFKMTFFKAYRLNRKPVVFNFH